MKAKFLLTISVFSTLFAAAQTAPVAGIPSEVVVTPYKTTIIAGGKDQSRIKITVIDKQGNEVANAANAIKFMVTGDAHIASINTSDNLTEGKLVNGQLTVMLASGTSKGIVKFDATSEGLIKGSTEIHIVQPGKAHPVTNDPAIAGNAKINEKILGADISFLPQLESRGMKFYNKAGQQEDVMKIMKDNGFNYIRLRIFDHPDQPKGYSRGVGFCDLPHTLQMAKRIKAAGMKFLLDIHYSDTWADPQRQDKPAAWANLDFPTLKDSTYTYTRNIMQALSAQGTAPDMVQVGNEINHGMLWPDGGINNLDSLANLIYAGVRAVKEVKPSTIIMLHIALGGQNEEAHFFLDNMLKRKVPFDVIGLSYYPKWHGTPGDLKANMADLANHYNKYVMVAEYSQLKQEVNDIAFTVPNGKAVGSFIWEPLSTWESFFGRDGKINSYMDVYPGIAKKYNVH